MSGNKACLLPISPLLILTISIRPKIFHSTHPQTIQRGVNFSAVDGIVLCTTYGIVWSTCVESFWQPRSTVGKILQNLSVYQSYSLKSTHSKVRSFSILESGALESKMLSH